MTAMIDGRQVCKTSAKAQTSELHRNARMLGVQRLPRGSTRCSGKRRSSGIGRTNTWSPSSIQTRVVGTNHQKQTS